MESDVELFKTYTFLAVFCGGETGHFADIAAQMEVSRREMNADLAAGWRITHVTPLVTPDAKWVVYTVEAPMPTITIKDFDADAFRKAYDNLEPAQRIDQHLEVK